MAVQTAVSALVGAGAPIDGLGFQAHLASPDPVDLRAFSSWVDDLGLLWAVTEFDVPLPITEVPEPAFLEFQAATYGAALAACVDAASCDTFVTWGITDRYWPGDAGGGFGTALWFDAQDMAKPAFAAMAEVLELASVVPATTIPPATTAPTTTTSIATDANDGPSDADTGSAVLAIAIGVAVLAGVALVIVTVRRSRRDSTAEQE
jgi:hypothetical protein